MVREIVQVGTPVLRQLARVVTHDEIRSPAIAELIESMRETMLAAYGVGLAGPQIGEPLQIAVIEDPAEGLDPADAAIRRCCHVQFHVIVNPEIEILEGGSVVFLESCLSVTGFVAEVPRAVSVRVKALNHRGVPQSRFSLGVEAWYHVPVVEGTQPSSRNRPPTFVS